MEEEVYYIRLKQQVESVWPQDTLALPFTEVLNSVWIAPAEVLYNSETETATFESTLIFEAAVRIDLSQAQGLSLILGTADLTTPIPLLFSASTSPSATGTDYTLDIGPLPVELLIDGALLTPAEKDTSQTPPVFTPIEAPYAVDIGSVSIAADITGNLSFILDASVSLPPAFIGDTGIAIEANGLVFYLSERDLILEGFGANFRGVYFDSAYLYLPPKLADILPDGIEIRNCAIGTGGFTGAVTLDLLTVQGVDSYDEANAKSLFGFSFTLQSLTVEFKQNSLVKSAITGFLKVPFFDQPLKVQISLTNDGGFTLAVASENSLLVLKKDNVLSIEVSELALMEDDGIYYLQIAGKVTPLIAGFDWPSFEIDSLLISSQGQVQIEGGWIDLPDQKALDLYGFRMEISQIGFGNETDGRRWIGFSGGLNLIDQLPTGTSVEGLRVLWNPVGDPNPQLTLQGMGLELTLPGVLSFAGDVALIDDGSDRYFQGNAKLSLLPMGINLDAAIKIGHNSDPDYNYLYIFLSLQLPIGIPLWTSGAALYGISGLYGMNVFPNVANNDWYAWYIGAPKFDVTDASKWGDRPDALAFGAGMVLGTLPDAGFSVSTKSLLALVLPGPVMVFHGRANMIKTPPGLTDPNSEGTFDMLAVLDAQAGFMQINLDAGWSIPVMVDLSASAEAYFDFANPRNWHLYLGQDEPEDRRVRAFVVALFHADAYIMIESTGIRAGFGVHWGQDWKFGPVKVVLQSIIGAEAGITWQPQQLEGTLSLGGEFEISVAGFGVGLSAIASLSAKAPTLYWIKGELELSVKLPFPTKDLEETITLEWRQDAAPPFEKPLETIGLEHLKVDETWAIASYEQQTLIPTTNGYLPGPLVPLDALPAIVFDRSIKDDTTGINDPDQAETRIDLGSVNVYPGATAIGDYSFDYALTTITLEKWSKAGGKTWQTVDNLYGTWMAIEGSDGEPTASKLLLWAKTPFAFTRQSSRTYRDWFLSNNTSWPCADVPQITRVCIDWEQVKVGTSYGLLFVIEGVTFILDAPGDQTTSIVEPYSLTDFGTHQALRLPDNATLWIVFSEPVRTVELWLGDLFRSVTTYAQGDLLEQLDLSQITLNSPNGHHIVLSAPGMESLKLQGWDNPRLVKICYETEASVVAQESVQEHLDRIEANLRHWLSADEILEPEMWYRLTVTGKTVRTHKGDVEEEPWNYYAYFQTAAPPGLTPAWGLSADLPAPANALSEPPYPQGGKLTDASPYVQWSVPGNGAVAVYRAYDIGIEFNENYVEQLYGADMAIRLLDANGLPVRDAAGNEVSFLNQWAKSPITELSETEIPYITRVQDCFEVDLSGLPSNQTFTASYGVLLLEEFSGDLSQWTDTRQSDDTATSSWAIANGQLTVTNSPTTGALLVAGDDTWTDYAVEVALTEQGSEVGLVFRYLKSTLETYYRLRLDATGRYLERLSDSTVTQLWQDAVAYEPGAVKTLGIQCRGDRLRGQIDNTLLFDLHDPTGNLFGKIGIYTTSTAAFEQVLVRQWPAGVLTPQTMYSAELLASFVLFQGALTTAGWIDTNFAWRELTRSNNHIAAIGRPNWDNYRLEVNLSTANNNLVGAIARFRTEGTTSSGTFSCYRVLLNRDEAKVTLARLSGTYNGSTFDLASGRTVLWECQGSTCGIDFTLDEHDLAITCDGSTFILELDGQEFPPIDLAAAAASLGQTPLLEGQAGLYYNGQDSPGFSEFIIRSAPRQPVYRWSFITSQYEGLVELIDSFTGTLYTETVSAIDRVALTTAMGNAASDMAQTTQTLEAARLALASATETELALRRLTAQQAAIARHAEATRHFEAIDALLLNAQYRPTSPVVEVSAIVEQRQLLALLIESPEPLDWTRLKARCSKFMPTTNRLKDITDALFVWNNDGTKIFLLLPNTASWPSGEYRLHFDYSLDLGAESPLLRRSGSLLPEVAELAIILTAR